MKILVLTFGLFAMLGIPTSSSAAGLVPCGGPPPEVPCDLCHLFQLGHNIVEQLFLVIIPLVAVVLLVIGGAMFLFSGGNPGQISKARSAITAVVVGLLIMYGAWLFVNFFLSIVGVEVWTGFFDDPNTPTITERWWEIRCTLSP